MKITLLSMIKSKLVNCNLECESMDLIHRQRQIIKLLMLDKDWKKGEEIGNSLNVTARTIRNDINHINKLNGDNLILSSNLGYRINDIEKAKVYLECQHNLPILPKERINYLLNKLLTTSSPLDVDKISQEIYVSVYTIENDFQDIKKKIKNFDLTLERKNNLVFISGSEKDKRKLISALLYDEIDGRFLDLDNYINLFYEYDIKVIENIVRDVFSKNNMFFNEYSIVSLVLHIAVILGRVANNHILKYHDFPLENIEDYDEFKITKEIVQRLESMFQITTPEEEIYYLTLQIMGKSISKYYTINSNNINKFVEIKYVHLVNEILIKTEEFYDLKLRHDEEFFVRFLMHIKNLLFRNNCDMKYINPLSENIRFTYPFVYEVAVFISNEIYNETGIAISEDEIGYIAIHIGAALEKNKNLSSKIKVAVIYPKYHDLHSIFIEKLNYRYKANIKISEIYTTVDINANNIKADLILSTINLNYLGNIPCLVVNPILKDEDFLKIDRQIEIINKEKDVIKTKSFLNNCFNSKLFFKNVYLENEYEYIRYMGERIVDEGFVEKEFIYSTIKREKLSSTSFDNKFAVPHALEMNAKKSVISVILNDKDISWGTNKIRLILLIAINKNDRKEFMDVYESIIDILLDNRNIEIILNSEDYSSFIDNISQLVGSEQYGK